MECPKCGGRTRVVDTRVLDGQVRRARVCRECGELFKTREVCMGGRNVAPPPHVETHHCNA
jgi:transcriptional regulator NrdR family protein